MYMLEQANIQSLQENKSVYRMTGKLGPLLVLCSPEEGHPSPKVLGKYYFSQKLLTGQLSTAHGYPSASPTKRDNTPFKKTTRSEAVVAEVPASRSGRERRHTPLWGVAPFKGPAPFGGSATLHLRMDCAISSLDS